MVKLGGSVLTTSTAYRPAAQFLAKRIRGSSEEQIVAVVSAQEGLTDMDSMSAGKRPLFRRVINLAS